MIWFTCQQCGKKHGRPEKAIGSLVFCECGQGNMVPWESTAQAETVGVAEEAPLVPELAPVKFEPVPVPPAYPRAEPKPLRDERRPRRKRRDPNECLNHPDVVREAACVDCGASFCQDCLVYLQAKPLCGQCKNQRLRALHRELPTSQLALLSLLLALFTGPLAFILYAMGVMGRGDTSKFPLLGLVPQLIALALGVWALQRIEKNRALGGQALALSAIFTAGLAMFWSVFVTYYGPRLWG